MPKHQMLINVVPGEECRIAIVADGRLEELYQERASAESHVGNIYKGRVTNVEPSIQAAFVDFGQARNGFLHISDLHPMYFTGHDKEETEMVGQKTPRRDRPPIQKCLRRGQEILVQVLKEGIGTKGPTLTSYLSIPGRYLVMMPSMERLGVSRKVEDDDARREMRQILDDLKPPSGFGFIIRTAGIGRNKTELKRDLAYLQRLWSSIEQRKKKVSVGELFAESDLVVRTIRDIFSTEIEQIIVDDEVAAKRARDFLAIANPRTSSQVALYNDPIPFFHRFDIERQIENISARVAALPSGGNLVIDSTEALVAIDVNSAKMRDSRDAEATAFKVNMEAADEICRQLRLRDLGGVIVNDLIDMRDPRHRRQIETRFRDNLKNDRARTRISPISQFGILEMTRQRMRPSLRKSIYIDCPHCQGAAQVKSPESVVLDVMRRLALVMHRENVARVELTVSPAVAFALLNRKRSQLVALETHHNKTILVRVNDSGPADFVSLLAFDERGGQVEGESLANMDHFELVPVEAFSGRLLADQDEADAMDAEDESFAADSSEVNSPEMEEAYQQDIAGYGAPDPQALQGQDDDDERVPQDVEAADPRDRDASEESNAQGEEEGEAGKKRRRRRRRGGRGRSKRTGETPPEHGDSSPDEAASVNADSQEDRPLPPDEETSAVRAEPARPQGVALAGMAERLNKQRAQEAAKAEGPSLAPPQIPALEQEPQMNQDPRDESSSHEAEDSDQGSEEDGQGVKKRRRRRRGGRRRSGGGGNADGSTESNPAQGSQAVEKPIVPQGRQIAGLARLPQNQLPYNPQKQAQPESQPASQPKPQPKAPSKPVSRKAAEPAKPEGQVSRGYHNPALKPTESAD